MIELPGRLEELTPDQKRALLGELLRKEADSAVTVSPLSFGQQAMWYLYQLVPDSSAYNVAFTARICSGIDSNAFHRALVDTVQRHESLRTTFATQDRNLVQLIHARGEVDWTVIDASECDETTLYERVVEAYKQPFDLENGPMLRASLFRRTAEDHVILLAAHHIVLDGWSLWVLLDDLLKFYASECEVSTEKPAPLTSRYSDYVHWQQGLLNGPKGERMWAYWQDQLGMNLPVLDLPTDRLRPPAQTFRGATHTFMLDGSLSDSVKQLARSEGTTIYTVLLAAFQVLLHRYSGQDEILVGSPVAGRSRPEFALLIGNFINMVVLRANLENRPAFRQFLAQMREKVLGALEHQDFPFPLLVSRLAPKHDGSRSPIFQVAFDLQRVQRVGNLIDLFIPGNDDARVTIGGLTLEPYPMPQQEGQLDLTLQIAEAGGALHGAFKYNTDLFDATTIERFARHYLTLLESIVKNPDQSIANLPLLTPDEQALITHDWNSGDHQEGAALSVHQRIASQAERTPEAIAIDGAGVTMTYAELEETSSRVAGHLLSQGIGRGDVVGIRLERSPRMVAAMLGILKSGAAYLPLELSYPIERQRYVLHDSDSRALVTTSDLALDLAPECVPVICLDRILDQTDEGVLSTPIVDDVHPDDLAYVMYTSGSTGQPKGVEIQHRALANFLTAMSRRPGLKTDDVLAAVTPVAFDISVLELFLPLTIGAKVLLVDRETARDGHCLLDLIKSSGTTVLQATPVTFRLLLAAGLERADGLRCFCGGEHLPTELARDLLAVGAELWNLYGPTEATVWATAHHVKTAQPIIPIGRPIDNVRIYVLDSEMQVVPPGAIGELYIGGHGVAKGYRHRPELTAERFVPDPFAAEASGRMYRTGDRARYTSDRTIVVLGRTDRQIKLHGYRIEPGEIEAALAALPEIGEVAVQVREDGRGNPGLAAYITSKDGQRLRPGAIRSTLRQQLPDYMVPSSFIVLDELPLTANGKVDYAALPAPFDRREPDSVRFVEPETPTERTLMEIWQRILGLQRVSSLDVFFDLGASSIQAVEMIAAIEKQLGVRPSAAHLSVQTLGQLAATCDAMIARGEIRSTVSDPTASTKIRNAMRRFLNPTIREGAQ